MVSMHLPQRRFLKVSDQGSNSEARLFCSKHLNGFYFFLVYDLENLNFSELGLIRGQLWTEIGGRVILFIQEILGQLENIGSRV